MEELKGKNSINTLGLMIKGVCFSIVMTLLMILVLSIILQFSSIQENVIMPSVIFISSFSILMGSFLIAKKIDGKGIVYGSIIGFIYMIILYLISSIMNFDFSLNGNAVMMILFGVLGGAIGGILGINLK